jgi:hypothetical protein
MIIELLNQDGTIELVDIEDDDGQDIYFDLIEDLTDPPEEFIPPEE